MINSEVDYINKKLPSTVNHVGGFILGGHISGTKDNGIKAKGA